MFEGSDGILLAFQFQTLSAFGLLILCGFLKTLFPSARKINVSCLALKLSLLKEL